MFFLTIGVVILLAGFAINTPSLQFSRFARPLKFIGIFLILLGLTSASIKQIDAGKVGVQTLFGKVQDGTLTSGLNFINPLVDVAEFDTRTQNYTMSGVHDEGSKNGDDAIRVLSSDGLEVVIDLTVLYRVQPEQAPTILKKIGVNYEDVIVRPITRTRIRDISAYYEAVALYSTKRDEFQGRIFKAIEADFKTRGLVLEQLLVRNINLPESVKKTIESKINAEQEAQKMQFVLQKEKQEAERKRVEAQGISDYQRIITTTLTDKQLQYEMIKAQKEIAISPNAKVIIMGSKGNTPVILNDK
ncbi:band 7 protein [Emticicia oligotrophica DSM 17448]|uniref:Band 7 protein n=1 Tax=Emticicia oligotrophica (strain DSM 17448 / CIP 109782 / MTCC 6937 / GPTSA100-15) TaxID=929562 RepID=A0ABM5N1A0_EMTOG|nr:prohibitin family protein [Emticicia oligotrophica]AFK03191.1 band 7 protein [Emticicia oligotrophica DSM 17448]